LLYRGLLPLRPYQRARPVDRACPHRAARRRGHRPAGCRRRTGDDRGAGASRRREHGRGIMTTSDPAAVLLTAATEAAPAPHRDPAGLLRAVVGRVSRGCSDLTAVSVALAEGLPAGHAVPLARVAAIIGVGDLRAV